MRGPVAWLGLVLLAGPRALLGAGGPEIDRPAPAPRIEPLAPGVYALIRQEPLGLANHANDAFVVGRQGVLVVDSAFTRAATADAIGRLRAQTRLPVLYVVNTHWHDDHIFGDQVYRDLYPGVRFVTQAATRVAMAGVAVENRQRQVEGGPAAVAALQRALDQGHSLAGRPISPGERAAYLSTVSIARRFLAEASRGFETIVPDVVVGERSSLDLGGRSVELLHLGPAATEGDLVAWLPHERILVAGDVVNAPFPFAYRCDVDGWIRALERIEALRPALIVPGHGPVLRGAARVRELLALMRAVRDRTDAAVASGGTAADMRRRVDLGDFRRRLAGNDPMLGFLFDAYFAAPAVDARLRARGVAGG